MEPKYSAAPGVLRKGTVLSPKKCHLVSTVSTVSPTDTLVPEQVSNSNEEKAQTRAMKIIREQENKNHKENVRA